MHSDFLKQEKERKKTDDAFLWKNRLLFCACQMFLVQDLSEMIMAFC